MSEIKNPLSEKTRGNLYIAGIIIAAIAVPLTVALGILGLDDWIPLVAAATTAVGVIVGTLAKIYLSPSAQDQVAKNGNSGVNGDNESFTPAEYESYMAELFSAAREQKAAKHSAENLDDI